MRMGFHGGKCCGIKVIYGFEGDPDDILGAEESIEQLNTSDEYYYDVSTEDMFYQGELPEESYVDRLDRYLTFLADNRPQGLVEVVLSDNYDWGDSQNNIWGPILKERGFRVVTKFKNSNSGSTLRVYHKVFGNTE